MLSMTVDPSAGERAAKVNTLDLDPALLLRAAIECVGCPHSVAASAMGYQPDYACRVLGNERGIVLRRLGRLPEDVQKDFISRWAAALGYELVPEGSGQLSQLAGLLAEKRVRVTIERTDRP